MSTTPDAGGAAAPGASSPLPDMVPVRMAREVVEALFVRTADGRHLDVEWGEPDAEGFWTPVFTATGSTEAERREHQHNPEQCSRCRSLIDVSFESGSRAEALRAGTPAPALPSAEELADALARALGVASGRTYGEHAEAIPAELRREPADA